LGETTPQVFFEIGFDPDRTGQGKSFENPWLRQGLPDRRGRLKAPSFARRERWGTRHQAPDVSCCFCLRCRCSDRGWF